MIIVYECKMNVSDAMTEIYTYKSCIQDYYVLRTFSVRVKITELQKEIYKSGLEVNECKAENKRFEKVSFQLGRQSHECLSS